MAKTAVVVPNWNGKTTIGSCLDSLLSQTTDTHIVVVDNGSTDGSVEFIKQTYPSVDLIVNKKNLGFAGGVNTGIEYAIKLNASFIALLNNDAVADKDWLKYLVSDLEENNSVGIVTCKFISLDREHLDSTGDLYTNWGLPYPRGRGESQGTQYDSNLEVFSASGGASLYRTKLFEDIGLFDKDFFAYYEDVDISFRAQLAGWKIRYVPKAIAYHDTGTTSSKIKGFTTYQTMKNLPWLFWKNVPARYLFKIGWRLTLAYTFFFFRAILRGDGWAAIKGSLKSLLFLPKKLTQRQQIQSKTRVKSDYIWGILTHDLPPNSDKLRRLRSKFWKVKKARR